MNAEFLVEIPDNDDKKIRHLVSYMRSLGIKFSYLDTSYDVHDLLVDHVSFIGDSDVGDEFSYSRDELLKVTNKNKIDLLMSYVKDLVKSSKFSVNRSSNVITLFISEPRQSSCLGYSNYWYKIKVNDTFDTVTINLKDDRYNIADDLHKELLSL